MNTSLITTSDVHQLLSQYLVAFDKEKFEENLHIFIEAAIDRDDYSFNTGLLGAGWLLSFGYQHDLVEGDIDEVLSDFDDNFYKLALRIIVDVNSSLEDTLNLIHYFQQRVQNKPLKHNFYRRFALFETIKLLTEKLNSLLKNNSLTRYEEIEAVLKISYLSQTCMNEKEIEEIYYSKTEELIEKYRTLPELSSEDLYYLHLLQLSCIHYNNL